MWRRFLPRNPGNSEPEAYNPTMCKPIAGFGAPSRLTTILRVLFERRVKLPVRWVIWMDAEGILSLTFSRQGLPAEADIPYPARARN